MLLTDFDYELPQELIAQEGTVYREKSRLMVLEKDGSFTHHLFEDLISYLHSGDLVIVNDARVAKARLLGRKETGGKIDCLLIPQKLNSAIREVYLRPSNVKVGTRLLFVETFPGKETVTRAKVLERIGGSKFKLEFEDLSVIDRLGQLPIPPYIKKRLPDPERYQTIFSKKEGSLAAPTAGLHFTEDLIHTLKTLGVEFAHITLHIGIGTFAPIRTENVEAWTMHAECYELTQENGDKINRAIEQKRRIFAVGTTTVRTLETITQNNKVTAGEGWTNIFIYPGYSFKFPYAGMLTNFHLPQSTLLLLGSAFAGKEKIFSAYREAIEKKYRFFSLGDAMLILK